MNPACLFNPAHRTCPCQDPDDDQPPRPIEDVPTGSYL